MTLLNAQDQQSIDLIYAIGDKNLDGSLSKDEFKGLVQMMGQTVTDSEINMYWPFLDTNQDGLISKAELTALADQNQSNQFPTGSLRVYTKTEKVNFLMNRYDTNKNGNLGFTEVRVLLADLGYSNPTNN